MALGVDHVQFSVPEISRTVPFLAERGWALSFEEPDFVTAPRPYFREVPKSMAFLKHAGAALELLNGSAEAGPDTWTPVFGARLPGSRGSGAAPVGEPVQVEELGGVCLCAPQETAEVPLTGVVLRSVDPPASGRFLQALGFRPAPPGAAHQWRFPASLVGMPLEVTVVPGAAPREPSYVDDLGMSLVALISRDLAADVAGLAQEGYHTTEVFRYTIHGRSIANVLVHGPGGERVELIQIGKA